MHPQDPTGPQGQSPEPSPQPGNTDRPAAGMPQAPGARMMQTGYAPPPPGYQPPMYPPPGYPMPGQMMAPMPMAPYGMPPQKKRSGARTFLTVVGVLFLCGSLLLNLVLLVALAGSMMGGADDAGTVQTTLYSGDATNKVALLPVQGMINAQTAEQMNKWLDAVQRDPDVRAVVLAVDTPGGSVTASDMIYMRLERFRKEKGVPIIVTMGGLATSGGYYISANADQIFAQPTTLTGNIGVLMPRYNLSELMKKWGVSESTITAPKNGYKNAGSMFQPESEKDTAYLQGLIDEMYGRFTGIVTAGRGSKLKDPIASIANGQVYTAKQAEKNGLIDGIGDLTAALAYLQNTHAISNPTVVRFDRRVTFFEALGGPRQQGPSININGLEIKIDPMTLQELTAPRPMYLWRGE